MEKRNITIVTTQNQSKYVINTDATTLRELKAAMNEQRINYEGMAFYEGLSHTELLTDDAVLPHDVPYRGQTTNELVFMLTTPNKKIKSGAGAFDTRQALYETIEEMGLKDACVQAYGKNFTQCKNSELMALIEDAQEAAAEECGCNCKNVAGAFHILLDALEEEDVLDAGTVNEIRYALTHTSDMEVVNSPYSDEELADILSFLNN